MSWVVDNATVLCALWICAALGLLAAWWTTRKRIFAIGLAVAAGLVLLILLLMQWIVTDRQQIERALRTMAHSMKDRPPTGVFEHVSKNFQSTFTVRGSTITWDYKGLRQAATQASNAWPIEDVNIQDFDVKNLTGSEANITFTAIPVLKDMVAPRFPCEARFVLEEDGKWRMIALKIFQPMNDTNQPFNIPL